MFVEGVALGLTIAASGFAGLWYRAECRMRRCRRSAAQIEQALVAATAREREAQKTAAALRATLDALPLPVWRRRQDKALIDCNREYAAALRESREIVLGLGHELFPPRDEWLAPADDMRCSRRHVTMAGERRLVDVHEVSVADGETIGFALDRTDVEEAQSELRRHIAANAAVLETLTAGVAIFGPDKRLKFFNAAYAGLWDLEVSWLHSQPAAGEILQRLHDSRRFPEYPDFRAFKRERCELFTTLIEPRCELMHLPDGRTLQVTISPHPFGGLTYIYDDVSDRLALECSYNTLAQVQRATLDHLFEGIAVYGGDGRLKLHNPAFLALWRLSEADVSGEPHIGEIADKIRDLIEDGGDWTRTREQIIAEVTCQALASRPVYRRDGSMLQVASIPLPDGKVLLTYVDISDNARIEQVLRDRNEALETNARLNAEFVANFSHELRTPLNTIIGFTEILHNQYFGPLNSSQREYSRGILDSAQQLMTAINDIVDLASIEASYIELERDHVEIGDMLRSIINLTQQRAASRGLHLDMHCPPEMGAIVADQRRLKQAIFNLISNAIKFTLPGGAIRVEAERDDKELFLRVSDTGDGMIACEQGPIPQPFARGGGWTGNGLGLSLVKSLVELHGGCVEIDPTPGNGTRVTCRLPLVLPSETRRGAILKRQPGGHDSRRRVSA